MNRRFSKVIFITLFLYGCGQQNDRQTTADKAFQNNDKAAIKRINPADSIPVTVMLPEDIKKYEEAMTDYTNDGGVNPSSKWTFAPVQMNVPYTTDTFKASAEAAAKTLHSYGDSIIYFKVKDKTAYILLEMDVNGWAGVTYTIRKVHPIVERTLLRFSEIDKVMFDYATEDRKKR